MELHRYTFAAFSVHSCVYPGALSPPPHIGDETDFNQVRLVVLARILDTRWTGIILPRSHRFPRVPVVPSVDSTLNVLVYFH